MTDERIWDDKEQRAVKMQRSWINDQQRKQPLNKKISNFISDHKRIMKTCIRIASWMMCHWISSETLSFWVSQQSAQVCLKREGRDKIVVVVVISFHSFPFSSLEKNLLKFCIVWEKLRIKANNSRKISLLVFQTYFFFFLFKTR